jgi:micrococcal nuclease
MKNNLNGGKAWVSSRFSWHKLLLGWLLVLLMMLVAGCVELEDVLGLAEGENPDKPSVAAPDSEPEPGTYLVTRVIDGDTIEIAYKGVGEKVRLIGIDTPESVHPDQEKNSEYGKIASEFTKSRLENQYVSLEFDVEERDRYSRLLAYVYLDEEMFNATLMQEGYAMVYTFPPNVKYADYFAELQIEAREAKKGLWADVLDSGEYVGSLKSDKYHYPSCSGAETINEENKIWFNDKQSAEDMGYQPCGRCNP